MKKALYTKCLVYTDIAKHFFDIRAIGLTSIVKLTYDYGYTMVTKFAVKLHELNKNYYSNFSFFYILRYSLFSSYELIERNMMC